MGVVLSSYPQTAAKLLPGLANGIRCHLPAGSISITTPYYIYRFRSRNIAHSGMIAQFRVGIQYSRSSLKHTASIAVTSTEVRKFLI